MTKPEGACCAVPKSSKRPIDAAAPPGRVQSVRAFEKKWVNGSVIRYHFPAAWGEDLNGDTWKEFKRLVSDGFATWKALGMGLEFQETDDLDVAEIRIGFAQGDGSWSYLGRDALGIPKNEQTMNFGWDIRGDEDTVIHEIGHMLGLEHEHQNPKAGIVWDVEATYALFGAAPNFWDKATVDWNILNKIPSDKVDGGNWDANSVMHYGLPGGIIKEPTQYAANGIQPAGGLSAEDKKWMPIFYPPLTDPTDPGRLERLDRLSHERLYLADVEVGGQLNLEVYAPHSGTFTFQTLGPIDTTMVLFRKDDATTQLAARDDSGTSNNAQITVELQAKVKYILRVRLVWAGDKTKMGVAYW